MRNLLDIIEDCKNGGRPECGKTPHVCPVCGGKGTVLNTLYEDLDVSSVICNVTCRSCGGTGIVWG